MNRWTLDRFSVMSVHYVQYSFDYYLDSMVANGIKHLDIWGAEPHYSPLTYPSRAEAVARVRALRKSMDDRGLKAVVYTPETLAYPFSYASPREALRRSTVAYMETAMEDALLLGTNQVFINTGCGLRDLPREESWKRCVETIRQICDKAEDLGITLLIEQLQPYESNLLTTIDQMTDMIDAVASPSLQICVDLVAMAVAGEELAQHFQRFGSKIRLFHFCDGDPSGHWIPGQGQLPLAQYLKLMKEEAFDGFISLEVNDSIYWEDPHSSIQASVAYLKEVLLPGLQWPAE